MTFFETIHTNLSQSIGYFKCVSVINKQTNMIQSMSRLKLRYQFNKPSFDTCGFGKFITFLAFRSTYKQKSTYESYKGLIKYLL